MALIVITQLPIGRIADLHGKKLTIGIGLDQLMYDSGWQKGHLKYPVLLVFRMDQLRECLVLLVLVKSMSQRIESILGLIVETISQLCKIKGSL